MNNRMSKRIREKVFVDLGYEPTVDDPKRKIINDPDFKTVYRAAKKNYIIKRRQQFPIITASKRQQRRRSSKEHRHILRPPTQTKK